MSAIYDYPGETVKAFKKIKSSDLKFNPMQLNKTFTLLSGSTIGHTPLQAYYSATIPQTYRSGEQNIDESFKNIIFKSIDQLFYKHDNNILYKTSSIFSIPQKKMGQKIKSDSFTYSSASLSLASTKKGVIYDTNVVTGSFPDTLDFYEGFNNYFNPKYIKYTNIQNVTYVDGVTTDNGSQLPIGLSAFFSGTGYIESTLTGNYDKQHDYSVSFFISGGNDTVNDELIIGKLNHSEQQYPFKIQLSGSNQIKLGFGIGMQELFISSSTSVSSSWNHIICQKTGSELQIYVNGTKHASQSFADLTDNLNTHVTHPVNISNSSSLKIGGYNTNTTDLQGYLDEIRIYNKALTTSEISTLKDRNEGGGMLQTNVVGQVFDKKGFIVISTPDYRYNDLITSAYTASYQSTITTYEMSTLCRVRAGEFNVTRNHSVLTEDNTRYLNYLTGSNFSPYITTIGLYDSLGQLLAVAKLGQPIKKQDNVDMNFFVRLDLDVKRPILIETTGSLNVTDNVATTSTPITSTPIATSAVASSGGGGGGY